MNFRHVQQTIHPDLVSAAELKNDPKRQSRWVAPGETVTIRGFEISCGLFYTGSMLYTPDGRRVTNEPSIINPAKPARPTETQASPYWYGGSTSYQSMNASERWNYLEWLASGRTGPASPSAITVFLCGLERRALVDARYDPAARAEIPAIQAEVQRLLQSHDSYMFGYQAKQFVLALRLSSGELDGENLRPPKPTENWDVPMETLIGLGGFAVRGEPLPAKWALAWVRSDPNIRLSAPALRCTKEFNELFLKRYAAGHGDGIMLRNNKTRIRFHYTPANRSIWTDVMLEAPNLPDVRRQRKATSALSLVASAVTRELEPYSRWAAAHHERNSLRAASLLPAEIAVRRKSVKEFQHWTEQQLNGARSVELPVHEFVNLWSRSSTGNMTRREAEQLSEFLEGLQLGIEPDIRFGGVESSRVETLTLFRLPEPTRPGQSAGFAGAMTLLRLGIVIALDNGAASPAQTDLLERFIARAPGLDTNERARLTARLHSMLKRPVDIRGLKQRCAELESDDLRQRYARFLVVLAGIDARIGPGEMKTLEKAYKLLGLKREEIARDVHVVATAMNEPVTIIPADDDAPGYALPAERSETPRDRVQLSTDRVAAIVAETQQVGDVLGDVFMDVETEHDAPAPTGGSPSPNGTLGLDDAHTALARRLSARARWSRTELEQLCAEFGLLASGAIEALNEAAFDLADDPFLEGDDPVDVNTEFVAEYMHA